MAKDDPAGWVGQRVIRTISVLQIVGSVINLVGIAGLITRGSFSLLALIIPLGMFGLAMVAGVFVWLGRRYGLVWFLVSQLLQVPSFAIASVKYGFLAGIGCLLSFSFSPPWYLIKIPIGGYTVLGEDFVNFAVSINVASEELKPGPITEPSWLLGVNIVSLFVSIYMFKKLRRKM